MRRLKYKPGQESGSRTTTNIPILGGVRAQGRDRQGLHQASGAATAWDLGANTGYFSKLACDLGLRVIAFESDPACVDRTYNEAEAKDAHDSCRWFRTWRTPHRRSAGRTRNERRFLSVGGPNCCWRALVHHLVLAGNQPLENVAAFFERLSDWLVIEFVPEDDVQALSLRERTRGIHHRYDREHFEQCMRRYFRVLVAKPVSKSGRTLYLMRRSESGED